MKLSKKPINQLFDMICYILLLFLVTSCCDPFPEGRERYEHAARVRGKYARLAIHEGLEPFGSGHGTSGDVENIYLSFIKVGYYSLSEARIYMVQHAEKFLHTVNEDRDIRPHLREFPATSKLIELDFLFRNLDGSKVEPPFMSSVRLISGEIRYSIETGRVLAKIIHYETYEEALEWVKENAPEALVEF